MHLVTTVNDKPAAPPPAYAGHSRGFDHVSLVDHRVPGCVHHRIGLCQLAPGGFIAPHVHSFEEGIYFLEGEVLCQIDSRAYRFTAGDFAFVPTGVAHAWRNAGDRPARWHETVSPQPRPEGHPEVDTFFLPGGIPPADGERPDLADPRTMYLGHFDDSQLPPPSQIQMEGYRGSSIHGISLKMLIDRFLGAHHFTSFIVEFQPGGAGTVHDHPFEESYYFLSGEAEGILDGQPYQVKAGDFVWAGVGATHGFFPRGDRPVRWLETQAPQPPSQHAFRFNAQWRYLAEKLGRMDP